VHGRVERPAQRFERLSIPYVADEDLTRGLHGTQVQTEPGVEVIEHANGIASLDQKFDEMRSDEPGPPEHHESHRIYVSHVQAKVATQDLRSVRFELN
jgi:hypothetical protein